MIATVPLLPPRNLRAQQLWAAAGLALAFVAGLAVAGGGGLRSAGLVALGAASVALVVISAWRPVIGCAVLAFVVPLTAGLGRDTVIPVARSSELVLALVAVGLGLHLLPSRHHAPFSLLDLAVGAYAIGGALIPWLVIYVSHSAADLGVWRSVLAPIQYLVIYWLFSRADLGGIGRTQILNLAMAASLIAGLVGLAQLADVPGLRTFIDNTFPLDHSGDPSCQFGICRPTSFFEHASSFGAFMLLNYLLALALATYRRRDFPRWWLTLVIGINAVGVLASQTQAAIIGLVLGTVIIVWHGRRVPRELLAMAVALVLGSIVFLPQVTDRIQQQFDPVATAGSASPRSLSVRFQYWNQYFLPDIADHFLSGTGTVIPSDVPTQLVTYVDNEYFRMAFRAGVIGVALLLLMLLTIGMVGWRCRAGPDSWAPPIGAACVAFVVVLAIMGTTAEYLTFAGVAQQFWMIVGMLGGLVLATSPVRPVAILSPADASTPTGSRWAAAVRAPLGRVPLLAQTSLIRSSTVVLIGNAGARLLGFLFSVAAARLLLPQDYGIFAYALAVANIAAILVTNAPYGLSRWLPLHRGDPKAQDEFFSNVVAVVLALGGLSVVLAIPVALVAGIHGGLLLGVVANILGVAVLQTYLQTQRGQQRFVAMTVPYLLANVLQLIGILGLAAIGRRSPALFLTVYGLSSVVAVLALYPVLPFGRQFILQTVRLARARAILRFVMPLLLHTAFFTVWYGFDLVLVERLVSPAAAGNYAAAKALATVLALAPQAIGAVLLPRIPGLRSAEVRGHLLPALGLTALLTLPLIAVVLVLRRPLLLLFFGSRYLDASQPFVLLAVGMALYGFYVVLEAVWIGRGRPGVDALAAGCGMATAVMMGLILVPRLAAGGAALAFLTGSAVQLAILLAISARTLGSDHPLSMAGSDETSS